MLEQQLMAQAYHAEQQRMLQDSYGHEQSLSDSSRSTSLVRQLISPLNRLILAGAVVGATFMGIATSAEAANFSQGQEALKDGPNNRNKNHDKNEEDDRNKNERKKSDSKKGSRSNQNDNNNDNNDEVLNGPFPPKDEHCPQLIPGYNPIRDNQSTIYCEGPITVPPKEEFCPVYVPPFVRDGQTIICDEPSPVFPPKPGDRENCIQQHRVTGIFNSRTNTTLVFPSPCDPKN